MKKFTIPKKCLVIMPDFIGDNVILLPFLKNLKINMGKNSYLNILTKNNMIEFFKNFKFIDEIYDKKKTKHNSIEFLSYKNFDTIIVLDLSIVWSLSAYLKQIHQRVIPDLSRSGLKDSRFLQKFFTHVVKNTSISADISQKNVYLSFLEQLGMEVVERNISLESEKILFKNYLSKNIEKPIAIIHTSASFFSKKWSLSKWKDVINFLVPIFEVYWIGEKNQFESRYFKDIKINDLREKTSINQTIQILSQADLIVTTDSAPAHLAALAGTKNIIIIYGPTNQKQWMPESYKSRIEGVYLNLPCRPCQIRCCSHLSCIKNISSNTVIEIIKSNKELFPSLSIFD